MDFHQVNITFHRTSVDTLCSVKKTSLVTGIRSKDFLNLLYKLHIKKIPTYRTCAGTNLRDDLKRIGKVWGRCDCTNTVQYIEERIQISREA